MGCIKAGRGYTRIESEVITEMEGRGSGGGGLESPGCCAGPGRGIT